MDLKHFITQSILPLRSSSLLYRLANKQIDKDRFLFFTLERAKVAQNFVPLLEKCFKLAKEQNFLEVAEVIDRNLQDEIGTELDESHNTWRMNYLESLGISSNVLCEHKLLQSTKNHLNFMLSLKDTSIFPLAAVILALEIIIPIEYMAVRKSRDFLFPNIFVDNNNDSDIEKAIKFKNRQYIDDHIQHDAKRHYPDLLRVLSKYFGEYKKEFITSISSLCKLRLEFYNGIETVFDSDKSSIKSRALTRHT